MLLRDFLAPDLSHSIFSVKARTGEAKTSGITFLASLAFMGYSRNAQC